MRFWSFLFQDKLFQKVKWDNWTERNQVKWFGPHTEYKVKRRKCLIHRARHCCQTYRGVCSWGANELLGWVEHVEGGWVGPRGWLALLICKTTILHTILFLSLSLSRRCFRYYSCLYPHLPLTPSPGLTSSRHSPSPFLRPALSARLIPPMGFQPPLNRSPPYILAAPAHHTIAEPTSPLPSPGSAYYSGDPNAGLKEGTTSPWRISNMSWTPYRLLPDPPSPYLKLYSLCKTWNLYKWKPFQFSKKEIKENSSPKLVSSM